VKKIIGLVGRAGAGKSYLADQFVAYIKHYYRDYPFLNSLSVDKLSFATPLKKMLATLIGEDLVFEKDKEIVHPILGKSTRYALQTLGTEWGRNLINPDIWANYLKHRIQYEIGINKIIIIDDVRFENEVKTVQDLGGTVIAINNPQLKTLSNHESEQLDLTKFDTFINNMNEASTTEFCEKLVKILELQNNFTIANFLNKESE
jgi:hypothetical protein